MPKKKNNYDELIAKAEEISKRLKAIEARIFNLKKDIRGEKEKAEIEKIKKQIKG